MRLHLFILLFAITFSFSACLPKSSDTSEDSTQVEISRQVAKLSEIISRGEGASCTITDKSDNTVIDVTLKGSDMKYSSTSFGVDGNRGHILHTQGITYFWADGQTQGYKLVPQDTDETDVTDVDLTPAEKMSEQIDIYESNDNYQILCQPHNPPASDFVPPSNIEYLDPTALMEGYVQAE
jgi:hypothetical protein